MEKQRFISTPSGYTLKITPTYGKEFLRINFVEFEELIPEFEGLKINNHILNFKDFEMNGNKIQLHVHIPIYNLDEVDVKAIGNFKNDNFALSYKLVSHDVALQFDNGNRLGI